MGHNWNSNGKCRTYRRLARSFHFFIRELERREKKNEKHTEHIAKIIEEIGMFQTSPSSKYGDLPESDNADYIDLAKKWDVFDYHGEVRSHLRTGKPYKSLHEAIFGEQGILAGFASYNKEMGQFLVDLMETFSYQPTEAVIERPINTKYHVEVIIRNLAERPELEFPLIVVVDSTSFVLRVENGSTLAQDKDKQKLEEFKELLEKEIPLFIARYKELTKRKDELISEYQSHRSRLRYLSGYLAEFYSLKGRCQRCGVGLLNEPAF